MRLSDLLLYSAGVIGAATALLWLVSLRLRDVSIVDIFWGCGFVIAAGLSFAVSGAGVGRQLAVLIAVVSWGARHLVLSRGWRSSVAAPRTPRVG